MNRLPSHVPLIGGKRLAAVTIDPRMLQRLFTPCGLAWLCQEGLPPDATIVGIQVDPQTGALQLVCEHRSFPVQSTSGALVELRVALTALQLQPPPSSPVRQ